MNHSLSDNLAALLGVAIFVALLILRQGFFFLVSKLTGEDVTVDKEDQGYDFPDPRRFR